ncbi:MAG: hypothetical protein H6Q89_428 [Myxococcaceae bacterium]|nr:hypothetical protein [Myxococcaceae bacterium]
MNSNRFSRRSLMQATGAVAGGLAASRLMTGGGLLSRTAYGQVAGEKPALLVIYLSGGYNSLFGSADSYTNPAAFSGTKTALAGGLVVDASTFGTLPAYALSHISTVGVRHGITSHGAAQTANMSDGTRSYGLRLASIMGGDAAIKAVNVGTQMMPGPRPAEGGVSLQQVNDMKSTIAALGGATDPTIPDRKIGAAGLTAAQTMSADRLAANPSMMVGMRDGLQSGIDTLTKPVQAFNYAAMATAYGMAATATAVNNFTSKIAAAELMITAGANFVAAVDGGWDTHGDRTGTNVRNMMNTRILPPLKVFINRMMNLPDRNVVIAIVGDFARSLPGSDHASALSATVIGKYVKVGTTGKMSPTVQLPAGTPSVPGLWSYLSKVLKVPTEPFGTNPHTSILI